MIDLFLRAGNPGALAQACPFLRSTDEDGKRRWVTSGEGFVLDVIGAIVRVAGEYDSDGEEIKPPVFAPGFHANLRCTEEIAEIVPDSVRCYPTSPVRVWA